jgi:hypothetical protein
LAKPDAGHPHGRGVYVPLAYVDIMDGDHPAATILAQIRYWIVVPAKNGKEKLTVERDGRMWLVKKREDWWNECRIREKTAKRALDKIKEKGLIEIEIHKFWGIPTTHIWLNTSQLNIRVQALNEQWDSL